MIRAVKESLRLKKKQRPELTPEMTEGTAETNDELVIETKDKSLTGKVTDIGYSGKPSSSLIWMEIRNDAT